MVKFNKNGQWNLDNDNNEQLFKSWPNERKPEHPLSQPVKNTTGKEHVKELEKTIVADIIDGFKVDGIRQPTDQEMFGHLVKSEEEIERIKEDAEKGWNETLHAYNDWKPAQVVKKHDFDQSSWGNGRPILDDEELEELRKANMEQIKNSL